jgi:hypothetical protein
MFTVANLKSVCYVYRVKKCALTDHNAIADFKRAIYTMQHVFWCACFSKYGWHKVRNDEAMGVVWLHVEYSQRTAAWNGICVPREVVWIHLTVQSYFEDPRLGHSIFSCNIAYASSRLSYYSCSSGICIGWYLYSAWVTCSYKFSGCCSCVSRRRCCSIWTH